MCVGAVAAWRLCWRMVESPAVRHFFHSSDPMCGRCFRARQMREEKKRHAEMIRELRRKHG